MQTNRHEWVEPKQAKITRIWKWAYGGHATAFYDVDAPSRLAEMSYWNLLFLRINELRKDVERGENNIAYRLEKTRPA